MNTANTFLWSFILGCAIAYGAYGAFDLWAHRERKPKRFDGDWRMSYKSADGSVELEHLDGIDWADAPLPSRRHRCTPQTRGYVNYFTRVYRCSCGAISSDGRHWGERNERRKSKVHA